MKFNLLGKVDNDQQLGSAFNSTVKRHNEKTAKNHYVLTKIIDCILLCGTFELARQRNDECKDLLNPCIFRCLINFWAEVHSSLKDYLTSATDFKGKSIEMQNGLLYCKPTVCQSHIKNEISKVSFVSVIADETTDESSPFQLTAIFWNVLSNGQPIEKFLEFTNPPGHDAKSIAECIQASLEKVVDKPEKLISQSYADASMMCGHMLVFKLLFNIPTRMLNLCIATHISSIWLLGKQQVRISKFEDFIQPEWYCNNTSQRIVILYEIVRRRIPYSLATRWNFKSWTIHTVYEYRGKLIEIMGKNRVNI